ncbi:MAG TPA: hypothetical protein K8W19_15680 [Victivallis vadensis]|nr:hypothetical protein [Victivallis vadensis]
MDLTAKFRIAQFEPTADDIAHLREQLSLVDGEESDALLGRMFRRGVSAAEEYCNRVYRESAWRLEFAGSGDAVFLPLFPVSAVTAAVADGVELDAEGFRLVPAAGGWCVRLSAPVRESLTLTVTAGYDAEAVPDWFEASVQMIAADLYEHREAQNDTSLTENRLLKFCLEPHRFFSGDVA